LAASAASSAAATICAQAEVGSDRAIIAKKDALPKILMIDTVPFSRDKPSRGCGCNAKREGNWEGSYVSRLMIKFNASTLMRN